MVDSKRLTSLVAAACLTLGLAACDRQEGPAEEAGEEIDRALEDAGDRIEDATDGARDDIERAGDRVEDATDR